jgi:hypothetical protein
MTNEFTGIPVAADEAPAPAWLAARTQGLPQVIAGDLHTPDGRESTETRVEMDPDSDTAWRAASMQGQPGAA